MNWNSTYKLRVALLAGLVLVLLGALVVACKTDPTPTPEPTVPPTVVVPTATPFQPLPEKAACLEGLSFGGPAAVIAVEDADTVLIQTPSGQERIDYIGVNGWDGKGEAEGKAFNKLLVEGKLIELAQDPTVQYHNGKAAYYVYVDDIFVNFEMIATGNARPRENVVDDLVCGDLFKEAVE